MFNRTGPSLVQSERKNIFVLFFRIVWHCGQLFRLNRCGTQAAALAYHTIFGVVPLAIVMLMVFQMFPAYKNMSVKVQKLIYEQLNLDQIAYQSGSAEKKTTNGDSQKDSTKPGEPNSVSVAAKIEEITNSYISNMNTGAITFVGGLLTIWAAISLLTTIEKAFNSIWGVPKARDILHRTINYWALLTLGPLLIGLGIYLTIEVEFLQTLQKNFLSYLKPVFNFGLSVILMFSLYMFIPNAKIKVGSALVGAFVAAIFWTAAKFGFGYYVTQASYQSVYGIMGLIPLAIMWIYIVWMIVLLGLQLTYATQHVHSLEKAEKMAKLRAKQTSFIATEQTTIQIMREVLQAFNDKGRKPITPSEIADATALPADFIERILENLTRADLLCKTTEPIVGFVPSTDGANITLADISLAVEKSSFQTQNPKLKQVMEQVRAELAKFNLKDIL
jgi:YihY family inner membrane protein